MKRAATLLLLLAVGCVTPPRPEGLESQIADELSRTSERKAPARPESLERALLPPVQMGMPSVQGLELDPRFDLVVTSAPAAQVFMSIVSGTRYSMLVHPDVVGVISVNLKDVTVEEALAAIRDLYGYEYTIDGRRVFVQGAGLQTRVFKVNYLPGQRRGASEVRVQSSAVSEAAIAAPGTVPNTGGSSRSLESSRVRTEQASDFWVDLRAALVAIIGATEGRSVVVTPHAGVVVVRALPMELRSVEKYLRATRVSVERQVMLEAKIVDVALARLVPDRASTGPRSPRAGCRWARHRKGTLLQPRDVGRSGDRCQQHLLQRERHAQPSLAPLPRRVAGTDLATRVAGGSCSGWRCRPATSPRCCTFLETQGNVQVLSSPRIADDEQPEGGAEGRHRRVLRHRRLDHQHHDRAAPRRHSPTITVQPFFSGIALDVTPQIDENGNIILHVHPSVSEVTEKHQGS